MEADQYQKIKEIFQSVLEAPIDQRQELLNERCAADSDVRTEVERLLDSYESGFLENPAAGELAADFTGNGFESGGTIGHYTIIRKIGSGGMGEVYLAEDGKLGRQVAIKLLPETFTEDEDRLRRFEQEARNASALNHPNILTIHETGETGNTRYIATEYIDGETLRARLNRGRLSVTEALEIAIQCASALAAAHESGIIHRDIKPENIMLRRDNLVKLLDFGLAKLAVAPSSTGGPEISHDAPTERHVRTAPGVIMGTVQYMSPEQTRGHATDARTDIWSLGAVIYEMLSGTPPFAGENSADLIAEIVKTNPLTLTQLSPDVPDRLGDIVAKTLEKNPDGRYQTDNDLLKDLKELVRQLESGLGINSPAHLRSPNVERTGGETIVREMLRTDPDNSNVSVSTKKTSSAEYVLSGIRQHKARTGVVLLSVASFLSAFAVGLYYLSRQEIPQSPQLNLLTTNGKAGVSAITKDGKYAAFVIAESGKESVWLKHLPTGKNTQTIPPADVSYSFMTFASDGNHLYYLSSPTSGAVNSGEIHRIPILGGTPVRIAKDLGTSFAISPDESKVVFSRMYKDVSIAMVAKTDGSYEREFLIGGWVDFPTFLGSETQVALLSGGPDQSETKVLVFDLDGEPSIVKSFSTYGLQDVRDLTWVSERDGFLVIAKENKDRPLQIWQLPPESDKPTQITNDFNTYRGLSVTSDKHLVTVQIVSESEIWVAENGAIDRARQVTLGSGNDGGMGLAWSGNQIVYSSMSNNRWDVWIMDADGSNQRQLTLNSGTNVEPTVCLGRYIVFVSDRSGAFHVWRMDLDGNNPIQLTTELGGRWPQCLDSERTVVFQSLVVGPDGFPVRPVNLYKVSIEGGTQMQMTDRDEDSSEQPVISTSGNVAYFVADSVWISSSKTQPQKLMALPRIEFRISENYQAFFVRIPYLKWLPDRDALAHVKITNGKRELWKTDLHNGKEEKVSNFDGDPVHFDWSKQGKNLVYRKVGSKSDVLSVTNW